MPALKPARAMLYAGLQFWMGHGEELELMETVMDSEVFERLET